MKGKERVNLSSRKLIMQSTKNMLQRAKERRGITLVALVITILIIIILATVSLVFIFGEDGIIARAEQAKLETEVASVREQLEMAKATALIDGKGHIDMDHYWEILEDEEIIGSKDTDVSDDDGDGTYEVVTDEGFIFDITPVPDEEDTTDIEIDYVGTAEGPRISNIEITDKTSNSVTVKVTATNANKATYKYEYKKAGESNWTVVEGQEGDTGIITGLEQGATYEIRVTVETNQGTASKTTGTTLGEIPTGKVQFTEAVWGAGNKASVIISTEETGYTLQYQINGYEEGKWEDVASGETIGDLSYGDTVYGRLTDGTNESDHASVTVEDKTAPQAANIQLSGTTTTPGGTITATVTLADNESGVNTAESKWVYNTNAGTIGTEDESQYTGGSFTSNSQEIPLTATTSGTYYLHVLTKDIAGNKVETVSSAVTVQQLVTSITLNQTSLTLPIGQTSQLTATVLPNNADNREITWSSSNAGIASVSNNGLVTAVSAGTVTISATANDGSGIKGTCNVTVKKLATNVDEMAGAEYVEYVDGTGVTRLCAVLYDSSSEYGIEIITMDTVEDIEIGNGTMDSQVNNETYFNIARNSYNNVISTLNNATQKYLNTTYANEARCVGSMPGNPSYDPAGMYTRDDSWFSKYNGTFKDEDYTYIYEKDYYGMGGLGIRDIGKFYWLAAREVSQFSTSNVFRIYVIDNYGDRSAYNACEIFDNNLYSSDSYTYGLRPVFHLKPGIKITGGSGTKTDPYKLGT